MLRGDSLAAVEICNRSGDAPDSIEPPRREGKLLQGPLEKTASPRVKRYQVAQRTTLELGVETAVSSRLLRPRGNDSFSNTCRTFGEAGAVQIARGQRAD